MISALSGMTGLGPEMPFSEMVVMDDSGKPEEVEIPERRRALVSQLQARVRAAKKFHQKAFRQMNFDMEAVFRGYSKDAGWGDNKYVANILQRHVHQRTAALYSKNPKPVATRRQRLDYQHWDGKPESLAQARAEVAAALQVGMPPPMNSALVVQDYEQVQQSHTQLDRVAETLQLLFRYFMNEQTPTFKSSMKSLVRRVITTGVGFVKVGYEREMDRSPEVAAKISDVQAQVDHLRRIAEEAAEGEITKDDPEMEELMLSLESLNTEPMVAVQEGLLFDFPECDSVIVDPMCRNLRGFVGANWIAHELYLRTDEVKEIYGKDVKQEFLQYDLKGNPTGESGEKRSFWTENKEEIRDGLALVWEIYDRQAGLQYVVCDGYKDFLTDPEAPPMKLNSFWPIFALTFNELEHKDRLFPPSDIKLLSPMQHEYNRAREGLRQHRRANLPKYAVAPGALEEEDKELLKNPSPHSVLELQGLATGQKIGDVVQPFDQVGIDPGLYEVRSIFDDVQLTVGMQEASFGQISKGTATETSIAESSRVSALGANVDDLDNFMSEICRAAGQVLLLEMSGDEVRRIVGDGAVWPELSREVVLQEVWLEIEAGSTGKPNKAAELQNIERIIPFLIQIPGIDPKFLAKELLKRLDDKMDLDEAIAASMPSIVAMNQMQGAAANVDRGGASGETQGMQGGANAPLPSPAAGGLPQMPALMN